MEKECAMSGLAEALRISMPNLTPLVDKLIDAQLVTRKPHAGDRRVILITLTENGTKFIKEYKRRVRAILKENFGSMRADEQIRLFSALDCISQLLIDRLPS